MGRVKNSFVTVDSYQGTRKNLASQEKRLEVLKIYLFFGAESVFVCGCQGEKVRRRKRKVFSIRILHLFSLFLSLSLSLSFSLPLTVTFSLNPIFSHVRILNESSSKMKVVKERWFLRRDLRLGSNRNDFVLYFVL